MAEGKQFGLSTAEIVAVGVVLVVLCTPVYRSIWLDKKLGLESSDDALSELEAVHEEAEAANV